MESVVLTRGCCESPPWGRMCAWMSVLLARSPPVCARFTFYLFGRENILSAVREEPGCSGFLWKKALKGV